MAIVNIEPLSIDERLQLIEDLWESLGDERDFVPLTAAQKAELDRRLDALERDGSRGIPLDEALSRFDQHS